MTALPLKADMGLRTWYWACAVVSARLQKSELNVAGHG
jgi:hypothetical protein